MAMVIHVTQSLFYEINIVMHVIWCITCIYENENSKKGTAPQQRVLKLIWSNTGASAPQAITKLYQTGNK